MNFDRDHYYVPEDGKDTSDCKIYIGNCDGDDYMYMESTGNGDSFITTVLFQDQTNVDGSFYMGSQAVLMHRKREIAVEPDAKEIFYGWLWKADDVGFWAQEMIPLTWDDENEYTGTRFTAAAFEPVCIGSAFCEYTDKVNKNLLLNSQRLDMTYPRLMCRITLDENGELESLEEVDQAFYGIYNVGDREDDVSYDFMTFTWNGIDYDLSETSPGSHILDVRSAYGKKIVECHISPHTSAYHIFDTFYGQFTETPIEGTNLIWLGDDFSTAIYAQWNEVRDLCGDLMFTVDGDEILDLEFLDDGKKVKCQYLKVDADETKEEIFELPERLDHAMCAFCDYAVSGKASDYKKFMEYVPDDAAFFVVTDPQTWFTETQIISDAVEPNGSNKVMIVALHDNTTLEIVDDKGKGIDPLVMDRGQYYIFSMTVSETMPLYTVKVTIDNPDKKIAAEWPVAEFSGETYQHCKFITESGDADGKSTKTGSEDADDKSAKTDSKATTPLGAPIIDDSYLKKGNLTIEGKHAKEIPGIWYLETEDAVGIVPTWIEYDTEGNFTAHNSDGTTDAVGKIVYREESPIMTDGLIYDLFKSDGTNYMSFEMGPGWDHGYVMDYAGMLYYKDPANW
jgi:hypothetical protein